MSLAVQTSAAQSLSGAARQSIAVSAIKGVGVTDIAKIQNVSRQFVYKQKDKALEGIKDQFSAAPKEKEKVLYYVPVTKSYIRMMVILLLFCCRSSYRGVCECLKLGLGYDISPATVHNILASVVPTAKAINDSYDLSLIKSATNDEWFMNNQPVLTGVDIPSRFCYLLQPDQQRDGDTWAIRLMELQDKGFAPDDVILDFGKGINNGHQQVFGETAKLLNDQFHSIRDFNDTLRFFRNRLASAETLYLQNIVRLDKGKITQETFLESEQQMQQLQLTVKQLAPIGTWLQHDILPVVGYPPAIRSELYDLVLEELNRLAQDYEHPRLIKLAKHFTQYKQPLLTVADTLNDKLTALAKLYDCSLVYLWELVLLQRYDIQHPTYHEKSSILEMQWPLYFDELEDRVKATINEIYRTSSMIENLNSRIAPYIELRKQLGKQYLPMLQFYLNHSLFDRSVDPHIQGKSAAQVMTGDTHPSWIEMLGFRPPKQLRRRPH